MADIKLLTISTEHDSALKLGFPTYESIGGYTREHNNTIVIRWGNSGSLNASSDTSRLADFKKVINPARAIALNCDKAKALKKLSLFVTTPRIFEKEVPEGVKCVVRPHTHTGGHGFRIKTGPLKVPQYYYATEFISTNTEFRVWFANGKTIFAKRVPLNTQDEAAYPCRSNWGYQFLGKTPPKLNYLTLRAARALELELGAADVLSFCGHYYFLELNTAPTIDAARLRRFFSRQITNLIRRKFNVNI